MPVYSTHLLADELLLVVQKHTHVFLCQSHGVAFLRLLLFLARNGPLSLGFQTPLLFFFGLQPRCFGFFLALEPALFFFARFFGSCLGVALGLVFLKPTKKMYEGGGAYHA